MENDLSPRDRIEEAHGLWELAAQRVCAIAEVFVDIDKELEGHVSVELNLQKGFADAVRAERQAFLDWQRAAKRELGISEATVVPDEPAPRLI